jgi:hypothetical protein
MNYQSSINQSVGWLQTINELSIINQSIGWLAAAGDSLLTILWIEKALLQKRKFKHTLNIKKPRRKISKKNTVELWDFCNIKITVEGISSSKTASFIIISF